MRLCLLFLLLTSGIRPVQGQLINDSLLIEGNQRTFHFLTPARPKASLLFVLHGSGGDGVGIRRGAGKLEEIAPKENILLVYPDGYKHFWNECRKTANSEANLKNINDNAFFEEMIRYFEKKYQINPKQIFVVGTSGGGHMAYKLALTAPERFRAISAIVANLPDTNNLDCPEKRLAIPVMITNGTDDTVNPYQGGEVITGTISLGLVRSTERTFHYWAELAGYTNEPVKQLLPDTDPNDGKIIERYTYKQKGKPEITLLKVLGGRHDYPNDINVYLESWEFFKRQLKP